MKFLGELEVSLKRKYAILNQDYVSFYPETTFK